MRRSSGECVFADECFLMRAVVGKVALLWLVLFAFFLSASSSSRSSTLLSRVVVLSFFVLLLEEKEERVERKSTSKKKKRKVCSNQLKRIGKNSHQNLSSHLRSPRLRAATTTVSLREWASGGDTRSRRRFCGALSLSLSLSSG